MVGGTLEFIYSQSPFSHSFEIEAQGSKATCLSHRLVPVAHLKKAKSIGISIVVLLNSAELIAILNQGLTSPAPIPSPNPSWLLSLTFVLLSLLL